MFNKVIQRLLAILRTARATVAAAALVAGIMQYGHLAEIQKAQAVIQTLEQALAAVPVQGF
jgi:hypothetical protein